ncbi:dTDP-4-amino-4,6-dideoxygalactose transaminase [Aquimarina sp. BL5]|uniref:dTDP-4-amino-4,6-dideoxygalactose transaminase n=1 Tax=Aquimarina sp. BL5 TaxID=1714860 RepID=UPI000E46E0C9|nr:dTDP-4-amino-4,6-dideoxygalactose transaminase [Aquimarina sp. BL5]AXT51970.1 dTDP-4-amino-4,6-dideoxygalactose transaminase [Aquimarina sp. BL5]RKN03239.1 dTDP-4-amino-4,6-dideoxygalactose transaminase [Aquimarina sp. BL5]
MKIPFNRPFLTGKETKYIEDAISLGKISGNGVFTKKCQFFFENRYGFKKTLLTTSCTDALEMAAILLNIEQGDEVIVPSYTFVSSALAFARQGAKIIFADSRKDHPGIDENTIESLITTRTKAIVVVHYAGIACDMDIILDVAKKNNIYVVEDAAQAIDSFYKGKPLGSIGDLGTFSFHETKNVISGEGGMLAINNEKFIDRAEIIWEKGTNRSAFFKGEVDKYGWVDTGSSFLPSETIAAFLFAQLENLNAIQEKRIENWKQYYEGLSILKDKIRLPIIPFFATNNAHMFYVVARSEEERNSLIKYLKNKGIHSVFHYLSLHKSPYYLKNNTESYELPRSDHYTDCLVRLPMFYELKSSEIKTIINEVVTFYENRI